MTRIARGLAAALLPIAVASAHAQDTLRLPAADRVLDIRFERLYEIGKVDGAPWEEFQSLDHAAFGRDGRLHLIDGGSARVLVTDSSGRLLHQLGARGDGPGEYRAPDGVAVLSDGRVVVWDFRKRAFLLYGADGAHIDEVRPGFDAGVPGGPLAVAPDGSVMSLPARILAGRVGHAYFSAAGMETFARSLPLLRIRLADDVQAGIVTRLRMPVPDGPPPHRVRRAFEPLPSWGALAGGRVAVHHSVEYRIDIVGPDGTILRVLERPLEPRRTTESDRDAFRREQAQQPTRVLGQPGAAGRAPTEADLWFSPVVPPVLAITADGNDRIWVLRRDPEDPTRPGPVDVLSADGRYIGTIPREALTFAGGNGLPAAFGPGGRVVFLGRGELDVPIAFVHRLPAVLR